MNYEQKYKEALETVQDILSSGVDAIRIKTLKLRLQSVFPELAESEDEKIRKALKQGFFEYGKSFTKFGGIKVGDIIAWLEKQGEQKQTWEPTAAQLIVIKDLIEDKNTSKANKVILRGMLNEFKQFTNINKREIDDAYLQGISDAKHEPEKRG